jgi:hypothetical protein
VIQDGAVAENPKHQPGANKRRHKDTDKNDQGEAPMHGIEFIENMPVQQKKAPPKLFWRRVMAFLGLVSKSGA